MAVVLDLPSLNTPLVFLFVMGYSITICIPCPINFFQEKTITFGAVFGLSPKTIKVYTPFPWTHRSILSGKIVYLTVYNSCRNLDTSIF